MDRNKMRGGECTDESGNPKVPDEDYEDPISLYNLLDLKPEKRITINGKCYNVEDIYRWVITQRKNTDPQRKPISETDRQRIINVYNANRSNNVNDERAKVLKNVSDKNI